VSPSKLTLQERIQQAKEQKLKKLDGQEPVGDRFKLDSKLMADSSDEDESQKSSKSGDFGSNVEHSQQETLMRQNAIDGDNNIGLEFDEPSVPQTARGPAPLTDMANQHNESYTRGSYRMHKRL